MRLNEFITPTHELYPTISNILRKLDILGYPSSLSDVLEIKSWDCMCRLTLYNCSNPECRNVITVTTPDIFEQTKVRPVDKYPDKIQERSDAQRKVISRFDRLCSGMKTDITVYAVYQDGELADIYGYPSVKNTLVWKNAYFNTKRDAEIYAHLWVNTKATLESARVEAEELPLDTPVDFGRYTGFDIMMTIKELVI